MNRLQKKCFIASTGLHLLLASILLIGPAFLSSSSKSIDVPLIDFIPGKTVDEMVFGGGNPNAKPPAALAAQPPAVVTPPEPNPPQSKDVTPAAEDPPSLVPGKHVVVPNLKRVARNSGASSTTKPANSGQRQSDNRSREIAAAIGNAVQGIRGGLSGGTSIELKGPGGGGVPYANWLSAVKSRYTEAWIVPDGITDRSTVATVSVTIRRDGKVISHRILTPSGNPLVDGSVQSALDRVEYAAPLPDSATEDQRTVTITFDVRAKLLG